MIIKVVEGFDVTCRAKLNENDPLQDYKFNFVCRVLDSEDMEDSYSQIEHGSAHLLLLEGVGSIFVRLNEAFHTVEWFQATKFTETTTRVEEGIPFEIPTE